MKIEALRMFLAITALILTAMLTNPAPQTEVASARPRMGLVKKSVKKNERRSSNSTANRGFSVARR